MIAWASPGVAGRPGSAGTAPRDTENGIAQLAGVRDGGGAWGAVGAVAWLPPLPTTLVGPKCGKTGCSRPGYARGCCKTVFLNNFRMSTNTDFSARGALRGARISRTTAPRPLSLPRPGRRAAGSGGAAGGARLRGAGCARSARRTAHALARPLGRILFLKHWCWSLRARAECWRVQPACCAQHGAPGAGRLRRRAMAGVCRMCASRACGGHPIYVRPGPMAKRVGLRVCISEDMQHRLRACILCAARTSLAMFGTMTD